MRQVTRLPLPSTLIKISAKAIARVVNGDRAYPRYYRSKNVVEALQKMYLNKCFLCEKKITPKDADVDHFIAYHRTTPNLAYDWTNLQWCCKPCNQRKKDLAYRTQNSAGADIGTKLIDPSNPTPAPVHALIKFDDDANIAPFNGPHSANPVVVHTIKFLNEPDVVAERRPQLMALNKFIGTTGCIPRWEELIHLNEFSHSFWLSTTATPELKRGLRQAHDCWTAFLDATRPYSTCLRHFIFETYNIDHQTIRKFGTLWREIHGSSVDYHPE